MRRTRTVRYNKATNPSCAVDLSGWSASYGTISRLTGQTIGDTGRTTCASSAMGAAANQLNISGGSAPSTSTSQTWSLVGWVWVSAERAITPLATVWSGTTYVGNAGPFGSVVTVPANTWTQVRLVATTPSSLSFDNVRLTAFSTAAGTAGTVRLGAVRIEAVNDPALTFADGGTASSVGSWAWDGVAGSSTSTFLGAYPIIVRPSQAPTAASRPRLAQRTPLTVRGTQAASVVTRPLLVRHVALVVRSVRAAPLVPRPLPSQHQTLLLRAVRAATTASKIALGLIPRNVRAATRVTRPRLNQRSAVAARPARAAVTATRPRLLQRTTLALRAARSTATAPRPRLAQRTTLTVRRAVVHVAATRPVLRFRPGRPVQVPTTVVVQARRGAAVPRTRRGHVRAPARAATVPVDIAGRIAVADRFGSVLDTAPY